MNKLAKKAYERLKSVPDILHGGQADHVPERDFNKKELKEGIHEEEAEHTNSRQIASEIVRDHLIKDPKYYNKKEAGDPTGHYRSFFTGDLRRDATFFPKGTLTKSPQEIFDVAMSKKYAPGGPVSSIRYLNYYANRAGKHLNPEQAANITQAKKMLSEAHKESKTSSKKKDNKKHAGLDISRMITPMADDILIGLMKFKNHKHQPNYPASQVPSYGSLMSNPFTPTQNQVYPDTGDRNTASLIPFK